MWRERVRSAFLVLTLGLAANVATADIESGLVGYWPLNGDATDASGNGLDGQILGNVLPTQDRQGLPDSALLFPGAGNSYVELGDPPELRITGAMTLAAWVRIDSYESNGRIIARIGPGGQRSYSLNVEGEQYGHVGAFQVAASGTDLRIVTTADRIDFAPDEWFHIAGTYEPGVAMKIYINGLLDNTLTSAVPGTQFIANTVRIGKSGTTWGEFAGSIDDVRAYERALSAADIMELAPPRRKADKPDPPDGADNVTTALLQWKAGYGAVFHDVYVGTNPALGPDEFMKREQFTMYWHQPGIVPGTTYYWRVDEVEADGTTIHTGDVWSFTAKVVTARNPYPADGATYVPTDPVLSWEAGSGAILHDVYFGADENQVAEGTGDTFKGIVTGTSYQPEPLAKDTTYYWRIDEFDGSTKHKGAVWSFSTVPDIPVSDPNLIAWWKLDEGSGTTALDSSGHDHHGVLAGAPRWVAGYDGGALEFDNEPDDRVSAGTFDVQGSGITIACWFQADNLDTVGSDPRMVSKATGGAADAHWFMLSSGRSAGLYVLRFRLKTTDGQATTTLMADTEGTIELNEWIHAVATWDGTTMRIYKNGIEVGSADKGGDAVAAGPIVKVAIGNQPQGAEDRPFDGIIDDVRIYNKGVTAADIPDIMRGDTSVAWGPGPANGSTTDVEKATPLSWSPGDKAAQHDVYLGTDQAAVRNADTSDTTGIYRGQQAAASYTPPEGLAWGQTYYWRIDEVNTDATISQGRIWTFTVVDYLIVDDFEDYDDYCNRIFYAWKDGWGYSADPSCGVAASTGNGTGSTVGNLAAPFAEQTIVHSGGQSMPFEYNNTGTGGKARYSEAQREWASPQDWTRKAVKALTLYFYGDPANPAEQLYVALEDNAGQVRVVNHPNLNVVQAAGWQEWNVALTQFSGANLTAVKKLYIGLGNRVSPAAGGSGKIYIDDIRLYRPRCVPSMGKPAVDLSGNCIVDYADVEILTDRWLDSGFVITPTDPGNSGLVAHYPFNGNANDVVGGHNGTTSGVVSYGTGKIGQAIIMDGVDDLVTVGPVGISGAAARTISGWVKANATIDALPNWINIFGFTGPSGNDGHFDIEIGEAQGRRGYVVHVYGWERVILDVDFEWHHLAASYDGTTIRWYGDGRLVGTDSSRVLNTPDNVHVGKRQDNENYFAGRVDEVRIFNRVLSEAQIAWLAGHTSPFSIPADLYQDDVIDFKDLAVLGDAWLDKVFWP